MKIVLMLVIMTSNPNGKSVYTEFDAIGFKEMNKCKEALDPIMKKLTEQFDKIEAKCVERDVY